MRKRITMLVSFVMLLTLMMNVTVFADDMIQPLQINISTDKESYEDGDNIEITVTGNNQYDVNFSNVEFNVGIPEQISVKDKETLTTTIDNIEGKTSFDVVKFNATVHTAQSTIENQPSVNTGDNSQYIRYIIIFLACVALIALCLKNKMKAKKLLSILLIVSIALGSIGVQNIDVLADEPDGINYSVSKNITINGVESPITVNVHINQDSTGSDYNIVNISTDDVVATGAKYFTVLLNATGGSFSRNADIKNVTLEKAFENMKVDAIEVVSDNMMSVKVVGEMDTLQFEGGIVLAGDAFENAKDQATAIVSIQKPELVIDSSNITFENGVLSCPLSIINGHFSENMLVDYFKIESDSISVIGCDETQSQDTVLLKIKTNETNIDAAVEATNDLNMTISELGTNCGEIQTQLANPFAIQMCYSSVSHIESIGVTSGGLNEHIIYIFIEPEVLCGEIGAFHSEDIQFTCKSQLGNASIISVEPNLYDDKPNRMLVGVQIFTNDDDAAKMNAQIDDLDYSFLTMTLKMPENVIKNLWGTSVGSEQLNLNVVGFYEGGLEGLGYEAAKGLGSALLSAIAGKTYDKVMGIPTMKDLGNDLSTLKNMTAQLGKDLEIIMDKQNGLASQVSCLSDQLTASTYKNAYLTRLISYTNPERELDSMIINAFETKSLSQRLLELSEIEDEEEYKKAYIKLSQELYEKLSAKGFVGKVVTLGKAIIGESLSEGSLISSYDDMVISNNKTYNFDTQLIDQRNNTRNYLAGTYGKYCIIAEMILSVKASDTMPITDMEAYKQIQRMSEEVSNNLKTVSIDDYEKIYCYVSKRYYTKNILIDKYSNCTRTLAVDNPMANELTAMCNRANERNSTVLEDMADAGFNFEKKGSYDRKIPVSDFVKNNFSDETYSISGPLWYYSYLYYLEGNDYENIKYKISSTGIYDAVKNGNSVAGFGIVTYSLAAIFNLSRSDHFAEDVEHNVYMAMLFPQHSSQYYISKAAYRFVSDYTIWDLRAYDCSHYGEEELKQKGLYDGTGLMFQAYK